jgi:hypothetical protein
MISEGLAAKRPPHMVLVMIVAQRLVSKRMT